MGRAAQPLKELKPQKAFFIGIDSDGCVFDSMELKQKECFCPAFIRHFGLQPVARYAREVWEFVNLYSATRGCNRFLALLRALELLAGRREVNERHFQVPRLMALQAWVRRESRLGNPALAKELERRPSEELQRVYAWSLDVNEAVAEMVHGLPPFPLVEACLAKMAKQADTMVVSQTPVEALRREWAEQKLAKQVRLIAGQELGRKSEHLQQAAGGKYPPAHILMLGDAPGDLEAARAGGALFYPIIPGEEEASWRRLYDEALDKFFSETYKGRYAETLITRFQTKLPEQAPWQKAHALL